MTDHDGKRIKKYNNFNLTKREIEIANFILENNSYKNIANTIFISEGTVTKHASNIYKKCNVENKAEFILLFSKK